MSYTPKTWHTGDTVTATDLNNIENGIANSSPWDAVIRLTHADNSGPDNYVNLTPSIVSGTFAQLYAKLNNGGCPSILVEYRHPWGIAYAVPMAYINSYDTEAINIFIAGYSCMNNSQYTNIGLLVWSNADALTWD